MTAHSSDDHNPLHPIFDIIDSVVELYLASIIKPFVKLHEKFYSRINTTLRSALDKNKKRIPKWFTANLITYGRTLMIIPCLLLLAWGHVILPSLIVILVDFGDFFDGVVARYWADIKKEKELTMSKKKDVATASDDDGFEVVTTGSPHRVTSWIVNHRNRSYGGFVDAVCDKAFIVPCWILLLSHIPGTGFRLVQYVTLWCLILAEIASGAIRFRAYFTAGGVPAPTVTDFDFSSSAVKADHVGKAKQTFEMVGTALFILPSLPRYIGLLLLIAAVPLAYESVRRKIKKRIIYVDGTDKTFDYRTLKFWMQAKGMGSKLIVGVAGEKKTDMVLNACASSSVDEVIAEAPPKVDLNFLETFRIDYVVCAAGQSVAQDDVLDADRCLTIGEDGVARPLKAKGPRKD